MARATTVLNTTTLVNYFRTTTHLYFFIIACDISLVDDVSPNSRMTVPFHAHLRAPPELPGDEFDWRPFLFSINSFVAINTDPK